MLITHSTLNLTNVEQHLNSDLLLVVGYIVLSVLGEQRLQHFFQYSDLVIGNCDVSDVSDADRLLRENRGGDHR